LPVFRQFRLEGNEEMQDPFDVEAVARFENETWSRCAKGYMEGFGALVAESIPSLLDEAKVSEGDRVLDVGTGPGLVASMARERGADPVGLDFSEAMLARPGGFIPRSSFARGRQRPCPLATRSLTQSSATSCFITRATPAVF
jgi:SAM-dependent methyltransferase